MDSAQSTPPNQNGQWTRKRFYASVPQYDEPTQNILDPTYRSEHFRNPFFPNPPQSEPVDNGSVKSRTSGNAVSNYLKENRYNLFATLPLLAALLEVSLLVYFFMTYVCLPRDPKTGALPRISPVYSTWPFTSCIGSIREVVYKTFAFVVAGLYQSGSFINLYLSWNKKPGYWVRRVGAVAGFTSSVLLVFLVFSSSLSSRLPCLLVFLVFSSGNTTTHTHLFITAAKILATLTVKTTIFVCDYLDRKAAPILKTIPAAIILRRWKEVITALSFIFGTVADVGIYSCTDKVQIQTPGTACFKFMAVAAPAEWMMSLLWINFMLNMTYDFYASPHISAVVKATDDTGSSTTTTVYREKVWNPRAEDFELDEAPFLEETEQPSKALTSPSFVDDSDFDSLALGELTAVRGFI